MFLCKFTPTSPAAFLIELKDNGIISDRITLILQYENSEGELTLRGEFGVKWKILDSFGNVEFL